MKPKPGDDRQRKGLLLPGPPTPQPCFHHTDKRNYSGPKPITHMLLSLQHLSPCSKKQAQSTLVIHGGLFCKVPQTPIATTEPWLPGERQGEVPVTPLTAFSPSGQYITRFMCFCLKTAYSMCIVDSPYQHRTHGQQHRNARLNEAFPHTTRTFSRRHITASGT